MIQKGMGDTPKTQADRSYRALLIWTSILVAYCTFVFAFKYNSHESLPSDLAYRVGYHLPLTLAAWLAFQLIVTHKIAGRSLVSFVAIYASVMAGSHLGEKELVNGLQQTHRNMVREVDSLIERTTSANAEPQGDFEPVPLLKTDSTLKNDPGKLDEFMKGRMNLKIALRNEYTSELGRVRWNRVLDPNRIAGDKNLEESKSIIQQGKEIATKFRARSLTQFNETPRAIEELEIDKTLKRHVLAGFEARKEESLNFLTKSWDLELEILKEVEKIITFLDTYPIEWMPGRGTISFTSQEGLNTYNGSITRIGEINQELKDLAGAS